MNARFHIVGCVVSAQPASAIDECVEWVRRHNAQVLAHNDREAVFLQFDATNAELVLYGCRAAALQRPPLLRFGFASGVKESAAGSGGERRMGERGIAQACDLAGAAQAGQVLLSSQLGSLLQVARLEPGERLRPVRVQLLNGPTASAYAVEAPRRAAGNGGAAS